MNKSDFIKLLRMLAKTFDEMPDTEFEQFINGTGKLPPLVSGKKKSTSKIKESSKLSAEEISGLVPQLQECQSRDEVRSILNNDPRILLKNNLEQLAKQVGVHINKHDKREAIEEKIVESIVGTKLRSDAILGLNLKGSGTA